MSGSKFYNWHGAGRSYLKPGAPGIQQITANLRDRDYPLDYGMSSRITVGSAQNRADFSNQHAGVEAESIKAYKQNFQS